MAEIQQNAAFKSHPSLFIEEKRLSCCYCQLRLSNQKEMTIHVLLVHEPEHEDCAVCQQFFNGDHFGNKVRNEASERRDFRPGPISAIEQSRKFGDWEDISDSSDLPDESFEKTETLTRLVVKDEALAKNPMFSSSLPAVLSSSAGMKSKPFPLLETPNTYGMPVPILAAQEPKIWMQTMSSSSNGPTDSETEGKNENDQQYFQPGSKPDEKSCELDGYNIPEVSKNSGMTIVKHKRMKKTKAKSKVLSTQPVESNVSAKKRKKKRKSKDKEGKKFQCHLCVKSYNYEGRLRQHQRYEHKIGLEDKLNLKCDFCMKTFLSYKHRMQHQQTQHGTSLDDPAQCEACSKIFPTKLALHKHRRASKHCRYPHAKPYNRERKCEICQKTLSSKFKLSRHMKSMHTEHKCRFCDAVTKDVSSLKMHLSSFHGDQQKIPCTNCSKMFFSLEDMQTHFRAIHDPAKHHLCHICGKEFNERAKLVAHEQTHFGVSNYVYTCENCGQSFKSQAGLKNHLRQSHTPHTPYVCQTCHERFPFLHVLNRHMISHGIVEPHICSVCNWAYSCLDELEAHTNFVHFPSPR